MSTYFWTGTPLYAWTFPQDVARAGSYELLIEGVCIPLMTMESITGKVTFLEKWGTGPANSTGAYELDLSLAPNRNTAWREMNVKTDIFCSSGLILPDKAGRQLTVGGWSGDSTYGVRLYTPDGSPGVNGTNDWEENVNQLSLQDGRWYPTTMVMANGSIFVIGGEEGSNGAAVPTIEVLPYTGRAPLFMDWLERTDPNNLYPFCAVLPSENIFVAYWNEARILDKTTFETLTILPTIPGTVNNPMGGRTYPLEGTGVLLPQKAPYTAPLDCDNSLKNGGAPAVDGCNMLCNGNITEYCGGPDRLNLYNYKEVVDVSSKVTTTPEPTGTASVIETVLPTSTITPTGPSHPETVGPYSWVGCRTEATGARALGAKELANDQMTLETCQTFCTGFKYFGTEYGRECFCGNTFAAGSQTAPESDCSMRCSGSPQQYCGAGNRLSVYMLDEGEVASAISTSTSTSARPVATGYPSGWSEQGCWVDGAGGRILTYQAPDDNALTLQKCAKNCFGSDPQDGVNPQEYRVEVFNPPYLTSGRPRPTFTLANRDWDYDESITFTLGGAPVNGDISVTLLGGVSSTHGNSMGTRTILPSVSCSGLACTVTAPPDAGICPPGWFQFFVLDGGIPAVGVYVRIGGDPAELGNWPDKSSFSPPGL
ncbi:hypothetical protein BN1723_013829 [Verticillium longisporum]|uniref:WSC domain-containing protein n=1 Tax=Verticillium longisporum TaxID=100787 RepID=A0A0G4LWF4_VERLO|nr:hypothetical protein BN1723_013829 [Verticillium longisporum]